MQAAQSHSSQLAEHLRFIENIIRQGGPQPADYRPLEKWADRLFADLEKGVLTDPDLERVRACFGELFTQKTLMGHIVQKPFGYRGDFFIIDRFHTNYRSEEPCAHRWDSFIQQCDAVRAVRNRKALFKKIVAEKLRGQPAGKPLSILNLASGPCRDVLELFDENPAAPIDILCVDMDERAIAHAQSLLRDWPGRARFERANVAKFEPGRRFDLVWSAGLFDYFDDATFCAVLKKAQGWAESGGELVVGNFSPEMACKSFGLLIDWPVFYRTERELRELAKRTGLPAGRVQVGAEDLGVNLFLRIQN